MSDELETLCPTCQFPLIVKVATDSRAESVLLEGITSLECPNCGYVDVPGDLTKTSTYIQETSDHEERIVAHFTLIRMLGRGSFGSVWLAEDTQLNRMVALKLPVQRENETNNLLHEAQTAAHLQHPHIVRVYEVGQEDDQVFIASEYIQGLTLRHFLSTGKPKVLRAVEILITVSEALHYAHGQEVVHRDVKPANILLNDVGQPYVADFGIAKRISMRETASSEGRVVGTARYMSPEQAAGKTQETDHRSDIYAIGVILFEMLTGELPFRGNLQALLHQKTHNDPPAPRTLDPAIPKDLNTICLKCLEREPNKRYQSAQEVADELKRFHEGSPIKARPISWPERSWRWCKRRPAVATLLLLLFLSLTSGLASVSYFYLKASQHANEMAKAYYRSQMNLISTFAAKGDYQGSKRILDRFASDTEFGQFRGFEWSFYQNMLEPLQQIIVPLEEATHVALSRDGTLLATSAEGNDIQVWDTKTGKKIRTLSLRPGKFLSLAFSPTEDKLLSGTNDGFFRIWSPRLSDQPILPDEGGPQMSLARFSPDGKFFAMAKETGAVRVWDAATLKLIQTIPTGQSTTADFRISPDAKHLAVASKEGQITIWNMEARRKVHVIKDLPQLESIVYADDGQQLAVSTIGGTVRLFSLDDGSETMRYTFDIGRLFAIDFLKDSPLLAALAIDGGLHVLDTRRKQVVRKMPALLSRGVLARSADGTVIAVGSGDGTVKVFKTEAISRPNMFWLPKPVEDAELISRVGKLAVRDAAFLPGDRKLAVISQVGRLAVWDCESCDLKVLTEGSDPPHSKFAVQPGGNLLVAAGSRSPQISVWDYTHGDFQFLRDVPAAGIEDLAFTPSGKLLAMATQEGSVLLYETGEWETPLYESPKQDSRVHDLAMSPDGKELAVAFWNGTVRLFDIPNRTWKETAIDNSEEITALAYCPAIRVLALGSAGGEIQILDLETHRTRQMIKAHSSRINSLAPLGKDSLISSGRDREIKLWDIPSGDVVSSFHHHRRQVFCVAVSSDQTKFASGSLDGEVRLWESQSSR